MAATEPRRPAASVVRVLAAATGAVLLALGFAAPATARPAATSAPLSVAVVVPITVPGDGSGLLDAATLANLTSPIGALTRDLDAVLATPATVALDPMIPVSIRVLGTQAPPSATAWLARLEAAANEVFLLAYADADLTVFAREDALGLAEPTGFAYALDPASFGPAQSPTPTATEPPATPTPTATPTGDPGDDSPPPLPSTEELLAWPGAIGRIAWPAEGTVAAGDLKAYAEAGFEAVLLSSANVSEVRSGAVDLGPLPGLIADSAASALLREAATSFDPQTREAAARRLATALDGLAAARPGRSVVLTLDRGASLASGGLAEAFDAIRERAGADPVGLAAVLAAPKGSASVVRGEERPAVDAADRLLDAVRAERSFASILGDPTLLTGPRRAELLSLLSVQSTAADDWPSRLAAYLAESHAIRGSVTIADDGGVFVTSSSTFIPVRVSNALEHAVTVRISARPLLDRIRISSPVEVTIEPGSTATVKLDAQAITNGRVTVRVALSSPVNGTPIGQPRSLVVDLQAQWETVGLVIGGVLFLVFAVGIVRNIVRRRRRGGPVDDEDPNALAEPAPAVRDEESAG